MPCYSPLKGYYSAEIGSSGKRRITFKRELSHSGEPLRLPCGQCVGCRLERARQWAMRILHEKKMHDRSCFLTLTYDNDHLPPGGTLVKRDFQLFMKRLRKTRPQGLRFFMCGEYGDLNRRPHYHACLLNTDFADRCSYGANRRGDKYYVSSELDGLWQLGRTMVGDVTFDSAAYVARYVLKKVTGDRAASHYQVVDGDGEVFQRIPEYTDMSRRPGIGSGYYERFGGEVRAHDSVIVNGRPVRPPRFYDTRFEAIDPAGFESVKLRRRRFASLLRSDNTPDRRRVKEVLALKRSHALRREL